MPAVPSCIVAPIWDRFHALLPARRGAPPLGGHRPRAPDRVVFDQLVQAPVFGGADARSADGTGSATARRRRRDGWIAAGVMDRLRAPVLGADDRMSGRALGGIAVDGCIAKAPCGGERAGRNPVDRGKPGPKRSTAVDASGSPLGAVAAPANRHASPRLEPTPGTLAAPAPRPAPLAVHPDRGDDCGATRQRLAARGPDAEMAERGKPAPVTAGQRWVVGRANAWATAHKQLAWCTERRAAVVAFWVASSAVIIIPGRLGREAWARSRWAARPRRRP